MNQIDFTKMPIVDAVNEIIIASVEARASDIHLDPAEEGLKIRIRVDGILNTYAILPNSIKQNITTRIKLLSGMNITETRLPQDGAIRTVLKGHNLDLRVSSLPTKKGEKIVIRVLDYSMSLKGIEYLYFSEINYKKILKMIASPYGIILVTGATGSGKSTTVYSFLQRLNVEGVNLITVEDPVEMDIAGINQVQVNSDIGLDFAAVLRSILRQDPNVIMIGEIRDNETARIAVRASITGHLVLSTIHTNNSLNTIERLLDMDVERYLLASALEGIISQTLARKLCDKCKKAKATTVSEKQLFKSILGKEINQVYIPGDCPECNKGFKGRIALQEVLLINQEIRDAISEGVTKEELRELVYSNDAAITMLQDGLYKVIAGFTTLEEVLKLVEIDENDTVAINNSNKNGADTTPTNNNQTQQTNNQINQNEVVTATPQIQQTIQQPQMQTLANQPQQPTQMQQTQQAIQQPAQTTTPINNTNISYNNSINQGIAMIKQSLASKMQTNNNNQIQPQTNQTQQSLINPFTSLEQPIQNQATQQPQSQVNQQIPQNNTQTIQAKSITSNQKQTNNSTIANGFDMQNSFVNMNLTNNTTS